MEKSHPIKLQFEAIGTVWEIDIYEKISSSRIQSIKKKIHSSTDRFDSLYSRFRDDSLVAKMAKQKGVYHLAKEGIEMLEMYQKLYDLSGGLFTPLVGNLLSQAGYDQKYTLHPSEMMSPRKWKDAMEAHGDKLTIKEPVLLDFGAMGKGKLIDQIGQLLENEGVSSFCIDGSGDILYQSVSSQSLRVGLEHPKNTEQVIGVAEISHGSICASSGNRRSWGKYHHIMNPHTLSPVRKVLSTWVTADTAMVADALATCLFLVEPHVLLQHFQFDYLVLQEDYTVDKSPEFPGELYYTKK